ncbi:MAG: hypothetical protein ACJA1L_003165 [Paracoccaceae bacterium]|jgi:hypothetical protein
MTGQRFGDDFSPGGAGAQMPQTPVKPIRTPFWSRAMFFAPTPLLFSIYGEILRGDVSGIALEIGAGAALLLAAEALREGLRAEAAYHARASAARPPIPRKIIASLLTALGVSALAWLAWGLPMVAGVAFGVLTGLVHSAAFGIDPLRSKGLAAVHVGEAKRAEEAVAHAEAMIEETLTAARRLGDSALADRVRALCSAARPVLAQIEEDPRDLVRARRFLSITLTGARDATVKYARLGVQDTEMRTAFVALLTQLETSFENQRARLIADDRAELEVEIEVLSDRLRQDGVGGAK